MTALPLAVAELFIPTQKGTNAEKTVQEKLCIIWNRLHFLPAQQMDMAIKYSSAEFSGHLNTVSAVSYLNTVLANGWLVTANRLH